MKVTDLRFEKPGESTYPLDELGRQRLADTEADTPTVFDPAVHLVSPADVRILNETETWDEIAEVLARRIECLRTQTGSVPIRHCKPGDIMKSLNIMTPAQLGLAVHSDFPTWAGTESLKWSLQKGGKLRRLLPHSHTNREFTNGIVFAARALGWAVHTVSPTAFALKWYFGVARPEEIIQAAYEGTVDTPHWITDQIETYMAFHRNVESQHDWTAYPEGSPMHPSFPAMHGAGAGSKLLIKLLVDFDHMDEEDMHEHIDTFFGDMAHGRDNAGVHTWRDSEEGMRVGELCIAAEFPKLIESLGGDKIYVEELIEQYLQA